MATLTIPSIQTVAVLNVAPKPALSNVDARPTPSKAGQDPSNRNSYKRWDPAGLWSVMAEPSV